MSNESNDDLSDDKAEKISVSMPKSLLDQAKERAKALKYKKVSHYIAHLIEEDTSNRPQHIIIRGEEPASGGNSKSGRRQPPKEKRAQLRDIEWVSRSILGVSSCGKLVASEANVLGEFKVPAGKYPDDIFGVRADGDSMDKAKLPDGRKGIHSGDILICRSLEHAQAEVGKIVVALCDGETCIKRLEQDAKGKFLAPESTNPAHKAIRLSKHARVQAVVIDKV